MRGERILLDNLICPEGPRWHDGLLYVADFYAWEVVWCDLDGGHGRHLHVPGRPSGMGWLPDGRMMVVSMRDACVLLYDGAEVDAVVDLSAWTPCTNEMIVDGRGRAYVGGMRNVYADRFDTADLAPDAAAGGRLEDLYLVELAENGKDLRVRTVARELNFPNGTVITPDGKTLIIAESMAQRLTAFDIAEDGSLDRRRVWAQLNGVPDGICLDAEGCVWVAMCFPVDARALCRVAEGGGIRNVIGTDRVPMAVALGGPERDLIFLVESQVVGVGSEPGLRCRGNGRVRTGRVSVPGAGVP